MRIAIAAIFKDECEYILEWLAYHRCVIGIRDFIIADNVSNDGTSQLLQALDHSGLIKREFFPRAAENTGVQIPAYNYILEKYRSSYDYILFIDADEFLVNKTEESLEQFILRCEANRNFGAIALNWRIFGSSGNTFRQDGLVIERFYRASEPGEPVNSHTKVLLRTQAAKQMVIHHADLHDGFRFYNEAKQPATFITFPSTGQVCQGNQAAPYTQTVNNSLLYVAHFAVKSRAEHFIKKAGRGSVGGKSSREKGLQYFLGHDLNPLECKDLYHHLNTVEREIGYLKKYLHKNTPLYSFTRFTLDKIQERFSGWVTSDFSSPLCLTFRLDDNKEIDLPVNGKRPDVVKRGLASFEACGFSFAWAEIGSFKRNLKVWVKGGNLMLLELDIH